ncbi:MAG: AMP-binding protein, partial [Pseudomonadales bacterium]|nr:AMP-binding protein [Pseudomonadales bacterium]
MELIERARVSAGMPQHVGLLEYDSVQAVLAAAVARFPDKPALSSLGHTLTFRELDRLTAAFASWLQHHTDLQPGDRIAIQMPNLVQYPVVCLGALRAGLIVVNTNPLYT